MTTVPDNKKRDALFAHQMLRRTLNMTNPSKWNKDMREMFESAHGLDWDDWWKMCWKHFEPRIEKYTMKVIGPAGVDDWLRNYQQDHLLLSINRHATRREIIQALPGHLTGRLLPKKSKRIGELDRRFEFEGTVRSEVAKILDVYEHYLENTGKEPWEIGWDCDMGKKKTALGNKSALTGVNRSELTSMAVSKIHRAQDLLAGVRKGVFPAPSGYAWPYPTIKRPKARARKPAPTR